MHRHPPDAGAGSSGDRALFRDFQMPAQQSTTPGQPTADGPHRTADPVGGLFVRQSLEVAQDDCCAIIVGQSVEVLLEIHPEIDSGTVTRASIGYGLEDVLIPCNGCSSRTVARTRRATRTLTP